MLAKNTDDFLIKSNNRVNIVVPCPYIVIKVNNLSVKKAQFMLMSLKCDGLAQGPKLFLYHLIKIILLELMVEKDHDLMSIGLHRGKKCEFFLYVAYVQNVYAQ